MRRALRDRHLVERSGTPTGTRHQVGCPNRNAATHGPRRGSRDRRCPDVNR